MSTARMTAADADELDLSLVRDDVPFRWMRRLGLIPAQGLGLARRALFFSLFTWAPIMVWSAYVGRASWSGSETVLQHFDIHVRCLISIPVLILAQGFAQRVMRDLLPWFTRSGIVPPGEQPRLAERIERVRRLRGLSLPWILMGGLTFAVATGGLRLSDGHGLAWAGADAAHAQSWGFGAWWYAFVARPVFVALVLAWVWRFVLLGVLFRGISSLELSIVPTHPDREGGLGFIERMTVLGAPFAFAVSAVFASHVAHRVAYHDAALQTSAAPALVLVLLLLAIVLAPFLCFAGPLAKVRRRAELEYGALVADYGRRVHQRWILRQKGVEREILDAPEIGPLADAAVAYESVVRMRPVPLGVRSLAAVLVPAAIPALAVISLRVPAGEIVKGLLRVLM